jgi:ABC-type phosphate/phosphonate transport system substrate-binding protein
MQTGFAMIQGFAELAMYTAPPRIAEASAAWMSRTCQLLGIERLVEPDLELSQLWLSPQLKLTQTCGYPLMTRLRDQVRLMGRPVYTLPNSAAGNHCSVLMVRADDPRQDLAGFFGSVGLINSQDSNSGMNLLRHALAPWQQGGRFFSRAIITGSHRQSLRGLQDQAGDLAAIDSVTHDYLARDNSDELSGLRILMRSVSSPCLPYITARNTSAAEAEQIRLAMNQALAELPAVATTLAIAQVLAASEDDYQPILDIEQQAADLGLAALIT